MIQDRAMSLYREGKTRDMISDWFRDFAPDYWKKEEYEKVKSRIRELQEQELEGKKLTRQEIIDQINDEDLIFYFNREETPTSVVENHRKEAYEKAISYDASSKWDEEVYGTILPETKDPKVQKAIRDEQHHRYLCTLARQWNKEKYEPILDEVRTRTLREDSPETIFAYLEKEKKISRDDEESWKALDPFQLVQAHREEAFMTGTPSKNAPYWAEDVYRPILEKVNRPEYEGPLRKEAEDYLNSQGIKIKPLKELEELVDRARPIEYLNEEVITFDNNRRPREFKPKAIIHLAQHLGALKFK